MKEQLQEILRLRQSLEESIQANGRLQEHLKNHKAQQVATQTGAEQAGTEMGQNHPGQSDIGIIIYLFREKS